MQGGNGTFIMGDYSMGDDSGDEEDVKVWERDEENLEDITVHDDDKKEGRGIVIVMTVHMVT